MKKLLILPVLIAMCMADFGAVSAAPRGGGRPGGTPAASNGGGTVKAARAAKQNTQVKPTAGQKSSGTSTGAGKTTGNTSGGAKPNGARAAATQKVLNTGTKIATKTENTVIPKECQDAYYGCMDQFCMLENTSGGRCQCSDRSKDLNPLLDEITKIDQIAYTMATEGVERLQMGENAEQVIAMAKAAGSKVSSTDNSLGIQSADQYAEGAGKNRKTTKKTLDLSAFTVGAFEDDDDVFGDDEKTEAEKKAELLEDTLASKIGDDLRSESNKICVPLLPKQCVDSASMLQLAYAQKIKSDCSAYENSLKQQKIASNQKLAAAEKALREAALESFEKENKYELGPCITEFTKCIQQDNVCGEDYTGCTTLSAKDNVRNKTGQQTVVPGTTVKISVSTLEAIMAKKAMCSHITKQCVKANQNDAVWNAFLKSVAPALKSAEEIAEEKLRMECIPNIADCFQKACAQKFDPKAKDANYDSCLSDPTLVADLCKVKVEPCLEATGGNMNEGVEGLKKSTLWKGILAALGSMRADACTEEVKACLTSDNACGKDYLACVGLDTGAIVDLCPTDKLTACMAENNNDDAAVRTYVDKVAQGLAMQVDNSMLATCQAALKAAMTTYCGDENSCPNAVLKGDPFKGALKMQLCKVEADGKTSKDCSVDPYHFDKQIVLKGDVIPVLTGQTDFGKLAFSADLTSDGDVFTVDISEEEAKNRENNLVYSDEALKQLAASMNREYKLFVTNLESDTKLDFCLTGREVQKTNKDGSKMGTKGTGKGRFPNLTKQAKTYIAQNLYNSVQDLYFEDTKKVMGEETEALNKKFEEFVSEIVGWAQEEQSRVNAKSCAAYIEGTTMPSIHGCISRHRQVTANYDKNANTCTIKEKSWIRNGCGFAYKWKENTSGDSTRVVEMPKASRAKVASGDIYKFDQVSGSNL